MTDSFARKRPAEAIEEALAAWGRGTTDYGRALVDLRELIHRELNSRSPVIFLGDARSNFFEPRADILKEISNRAKQVYWLNPEPSDAWGRAIPRCCVTRRSAGALTDWRVYATWSGSPMHC